MKHKVYNDVLVSDPHKPTVLPPAAWRSESGIFSRNVLEIEDFNFGCMYRRERRG
jgi:hypothetical protein